MRSLMPLLDPAIYEVFERHWMDWPALVTIPEPLWSYFALLRRKWRRRITAFFDSRSSSTFVARLVKTRCSSLPSSICSPVLLYQPQQEIRHLRHTHTPHIPYPYPYLISNKTQPCQPHHLPRLLYLVSLSFPRPFPPS